MPISCFSCLAAFLVASTVSADAQAPSESSQEPPQPVDRNLPQPPEASDDDPTPVRSCRKRIFLVDMSYEVSEMANAVTNVAQSQTVSPTDSSVQKHPQPKSQASTTSSSMDTVQLSAAAQAALAAVKETQETPSQTAKEASGGDRQARRLLAREAAAKTVAK